ncbi:MAG: hypothetical protein KBC11_01310 [Candidatus Pacebacteria bacterium]|nr:hypothetical protein [Candidatus Paceibacterota bacterium]
MEQSRKLSPKFFFLSLGLVISLIASASAFLSLLFATLDHVFPDVLTSTYQYGYASYSFDQMRSSIALLIIMFPVFLVIARYWSKAVKGHLSHWDEVMKKWVIYLVVFLASLMVIIDLVTLVRYFVSGEITIRFILKVLAVLITAKIVGLYYLSELGVKVPMMPKNKSKMFVWVSSVLVLFGIVYGFTVMGGPGSQRNLRLDQRRTDDLQSIQWQVINFWQQKERLPESLDEFKNPISSFMLPQDPEFQKGLTYEYNKISDMKFELCATFSLPAPQGFVENGRYGGGIMPTKDMAMTEPSFGGGMNESWDHQGGRTCFEREIDPDLYPPYPKPLKQ